MTTQCSGEDELILLLDGEATENRAAEIRAHLSRCATCRETLGAIEDLRGRIARPLALPPRQEAVARILAMAAATPRNRADDPRRSWRTALSVASAVAVAAGLFLVARPSPLRLAPPDEGFAARGNHTAVSSLESEVGLVAGRIQGSFQPFSKSEEIGAETPISVGYQNIGLHKSAFALVFAVDAKGVVHWIEPEFVDEKTDPASIPLSESTALVLRPTAAILANPARGPLRILAVLTRKPLSVSAIETLPPPELDLSALKRRFREAAISEIATLEVKP